MDTIQYIGSLLQVHVFGTMSSKDGISFPTFSYVLYIAMGIWWVLSNLRWWYEFSIAKYGKNFSSMFYMDSIIIDEAKKRKDDNRKDVVKSLFDNGTFKLGDFLIMACPLLSTVLIFIALVITFIWFLLSSLIIGSMPSILAFIIFVVLLLFIPTMFIRRRFIKVQMVEEKLST